MSNIKFSQLPDLGNITANTIIPVVEANVNYTVNTANLQSYINTTTGNVSAGNLLTSGVVSATGNVRGANFNTVGAISATGNITGSYFLGNGSLLTGLPATYGNANVADYLPTYTGNLVALTGNVTTTANVQGAYIKGNGSALTSITASAVVGNVANATFATTAGTANTANTATTATFATTAGSANTANTATTATSATTATTALTATTATTAGTVTTAAQGNITSVGVLTSLSVSGNVQAGNLNAVGNVQGVYIKGDGSLLTNLPAGNYSNANVAAYLPTYSGNIANVTTNILSATGNVQAGNVRTVGTISATGNITGAYFIGNGSALTGITATGGTQIANGNSNVSIGTSNGNIVFVANSNVQMTISSLQGSFAGINAPNTSISVNTLYTSNNASIGNSLTVTNNIQGQYITGTLGVTASSALTVPSATAVATRAVTGSVGQIRAVTNSTPAGRLCFWDTTNTRWSYVSDNTAV